MDRETQLAILQSRYPNLNDRVLNAIIDATSSTANSPTRIDDFNESNSLALALNTQIDNTNNLGWNILDEKIRRFGMNALTEEASIAVRADIARDRIDENLTQLGVPHTPEDVESLNSTALRILNDVGGKAGLIR